MAASTLLAGDGFGAYSGFSTTFGFGSLTPTSIGGYACIDCFTTVGDTTILAQFTGDQVSALTGSTLYVDGVACPIDGLPGYSGSTTSCNYTRAAGDFTPGVSYSVDFSGGSPPPSITSPNSAVNLQGTTLAHALTAGESVTWSIVGGADQAKFELSGSTLRWASNGTKTFASPDDANSDNAYVVTVRATATDDSQTTDQTITVTVKAIVYVGGKTWSRAGATGTTNVSLTDLTGGIASAPAQDDYVVVFQGIGSKADRAVDTTSGYAELVDLYSNGTTYDANLGVDTKFMGSTPDTTVTIGSSGSANDAQAAVIRVFRGVDKTTPMDVSAVTATGTGMGKPDPASITPVTAGAFGVFGGAQAAATAAALTSSDLSGFDSVNRADTNNIAVAAGYIEWSGSGAINPAAFGGGASNSANSWAAASLVLRPASVGGTPGNATGDLPTVTLSAPGGGAVGAGAATGSLATVTLAAPDGGSTGAASAGGLLPAISLTAPTGGAVGAAVASGPLDTVLALPLTGTASSVPGAAGPLPVITVFAPQGDAVGGAVGGADASGDLPSVPISATPPAGGSIGNAAAYGSLLAVVLSPPQGESIGAAAASGSLLTVDLSAPEFTAEGGASAYGDLPSVLVTPPHFVTSPAPELNIPTKYRLAIPSPGSRDLILTGNPSNMIKFETPGSNLIVFDPRENNELTVDARPDNEVRITR